ncbi:FecR domain-containing protein [Achromobacter sp. UMC46]|uniref:FecR family protein n=1 Tax=Achromobacter sp. UMC46 TaxID=1862319 RepID=UPI0016021D49|nr:FecR domain-containing protein [Achromobacter sp. UMC46]MBB1593499.1 hypothetical protein [Achromobacter sp. UMC46]
MSSAAAQTIAREAAQWLMRLTEDDGDPANRDRLRQRFDAWKQQDPRHEAAARRMESVLSQLGALRDDAQGQTTPLHAGLQAGWAGGRRRRARRVAAGLAVAAALATPLAVFLHFYPSSYLLADMRSGAGQWQTHVLADQSRVTLEPGAAVNLHFDPQRREVELVRGDILVEVAHDAARPFVVRTAQGSARALGTRFVVSADASVTVLGMLESKVLATARDDADPDHARQVQAGEQVRITPDSVGAPQPLDAAAVEDAWKYRRLVVQDKPLADVLELLGRYRSGLLRVDRDALAGLQVNAVLPLDDPDRALQLLASSFPIRVRTLTPWVVIVDRVPPGK